MYKFLIAKPDLRGNAMSHRILPALRQYLIGTVFYRPARFAYGSLFDRAAVLRRTARKRLYSQFIHPDDLVFDVGANIGNYTETFLSLGAHVVAVEPDPRSIATLQRRFAERISLEPRALGRAEGTAKLHLCPNNALSTLSETWVQVHEAGWRESTTVEVTTLDSLKNKYGIPRHIKIDCEDYDFEVLRGMSFMPESLSFEFHSSRLEIARSCLDYLQGRRFNYTVGMDCVLQIDHWVDSDDLLNHLKALPPKKYDVGDVYSISG